MSVLLGQDANWDLLNYHLYNGVALLQNRFDQDLLAVGMQSTLNPLLDALYAALALGPLRDHPRALAALMGLWFGGGLFLAWRMAGLLHDGCRPRMLAALLLGVTGTATVSQIGTTTGELPVGVIMLGGLYVLLRGAVAGPPAARAIAIAGLLFGVAAGLKLTASVYAPAACLAAAFLHRPRRMARACLAFCAAWAVGVALSDGWWAWRLYQRFASPVFPLFNGVFRSPWYPPAGVIDDRFFPHGTMQWLLFPLYWLAPPAWARLPGDLPFRDPRAGLTLCLGYVTLLAAAVRLPRGRLGFSPPQRAALVFLIAGYATWLATSAILRYAVVIEVVAGLMAPVLLARLLRGPVLLGALATVSALVVAGTRYPASLRVPYGRETLHADMGWVEPGMLIVLTFRGPSGHAIALMPPQIADVSVINVGNTVLEARGWPLHDAVVRRVRDHPGRIVVVTQGDLQKPFAELGEIGLDPALANCRPIASSFVAASETGLHVCDARRRDPPRLASPFWAQAAQHYRTVVQPADATLRLIGASYLAAAGPAARGTRFIDWTDLLWSGVEKSTALLPRHPDPATLYVLPPGFALAMAARLDPATDMLARVDGWLVAAPGWRRCSGCTAPIEAVPPGDIAPVLSVGGAPVSGAEARARGYLLDGWWPQEASSVWSREAAELVFVLPRDLPRLATLVLSGRVFTGPRLATQRVIVSAGGASIAVAQPGSGGAGDIRIPLRRETLPRGDDGTYLLDVALSLPDATSPALLNMSIDSRRLGFFLATVSLEGG